MSLRLLTPSPSPLPRGEKVKKHEYYCDNAATSFPKAPGVLEALVHYTKHLGASAGRGAYPRALETERLLLDTRRLLARLFGVANSSRIIFTFNASDALNLAIKGLQWRRGDRAVISAMEHNSVLRPLNELKRRVGIEVVKVPATREGGINPKDFEKAVKPRTKLLACVHASNVVGSLTPIPEIGRMARKKGIPFLVDAAQTAGAVPIDVEEMNVDLLAFPGHKALLGPLGTGGLVIHESLDLETLKEGGTGSVSEQETQPVFLPDKYEPGSHNALGIAGWKAALEYILRTGVKKIRQHEESLTAQFLKGLESDSRVILYGPKDAARRVAVVSLNMLNFAPQDLAQTLWERFGIMTRAGLHCAPGAHQTMGSYPTGAVRFSFGYATTPQDVEHALASLKKLSLESRP